MATPQTVRILRERRYSTNPQPGEVIPMVAVTYQIPPLPPQVVFLEDVPRSDAQLRDVILHHEAQRGQSSPRDI